jgi:hypothetical protein
MGFVLFLFGLEVGLLGRVLEGWMLGCEAVAVGTV